jgi:hypothetical protein
MTISQMIDKLQDLKDTFGDGQVTLELVPTGGMAVADDTRHFEVDSVDRGIGGGAEITVYDHLWMPSWRERD